MPRDRSATAGGVLAGHPVAVVGDALDERVAAYAGRPAHVRMVGWVPTLEPYFEQARICVLPLLSGAGTKRKMIQALMLGTPVVGPRSRPRGSICVDGRDVLIADDPDAFVAAIERLTTDPDLWEELRRNGRARALASHGRGALRTPSPRRSTRPWRLRPRVRCSPRSIVTGITSASSTSGRCRCSYRDRRDARLDGPQAERGQGRQRQRAAVDPDDTTDVRLIAFYLPQFHPIPENDEWWGEGFTEWTNVRPAQPLFEGHEQPRVPTELGYYDLTDPATRASQASLAQEHGIDAFAYYHYWFDGARLLERPFDEVLASGKPEFPFALCWANESWSRRWDGSESHILQQQSYSRDDDRAHIRALLPALADPRAGPGRRQAALHRVPGPRAAGAGRDLDIWREEVQRAGPPGLHLLSVETGYDEGWDNTEFGFDGKVRFQPQFTTLQAAPRRRIEAHPGLHVYDYETPFRSSMTCPT